MASVRIVLLGLATTSLAIGGCGASAREGGLDGGLDANQQRDAEAEVDADLGDGALPPPPADLGEVCEAMAAASCAAFEACCDIGYSAETRTACREASKDICLGRFGPIAELGRLTIDPAGLDACIEAIGNEIQCQPRTEAAFSAPPACVAAVRGNQDDGEECRRALECSPGLVCAGTCIAPSGPGGPCGGNMQCRDGLGCYGRQSGDATCEPLGNLGSDCEGFSAENTCGPDLRCSPNTQVQGTCVERLADEEECLWDWECASGRCMDDKSESHCRMPPLFDYCDPAGE